MQKKITQSVVNKIDHLLFIIYAIIGIMFIIFSKIKIDYLSNIYKISNINDQTNSKNHLSTTSKLCNKNITCFFIKKFYIVKLIDSLKSQDINKNCNTLGYSSNIINDDELLISDYHIQNVGYSSLKKSIQSYTNDTSILLNSFVSFLTTKKRLRISSNFSLNRLNPITGNMSPHRGVDLALPIGTPILAVSKGKVIVAQRGNLAGNYVAILHNHGYITRYMHMNKILVKLGQKIKNGDKIGLSGNTGRSTGPHLHFELWINNHAVDPLTVYLPIKSIKLS
ncbi:hypothetical protein CRV12_00920 [Candidatus Pantoea edessiphila]|uniref:M23ase beta-sheet core domain-containing protein n=1 Tax=Candidatus Pantoea edessiphila TaxID=2044610 RepID=A0A2P5T0U1_9GAMM|nr:hypothetical protein CRV12_00920 [Candidatus Pantoea edessiphila]